jgi:hypothetical protein
MLTLSPRIVSEAYNAKIEGSNPTVWRENMAVKKWYIIYISLGAIGLERIWKLFGPSFTTLS